MWCFACADAEHFVSETYHWERLRNFHEEFVMLTVIQHTSLICLATPKGPKVIGYQFSMELIFFGSTACR